MKNLSWVLILVIASAGAASAQKSFYDKTDKVGFKYPSRWKVEKPTGNAGGKDDFHEVAKVSMPAGAYPRTNFDGGTATLYARPLPAGATETRCVDLVQSGQESPKWRVVKVGGKSFFRFDDDDGAAGHYFTRHTFMGSHGQRCYQVVLEVAEANADSLPKRKGYKEVNTNAVLAQLETVVRSLYF